MIEKLTVGSKSYINVPANVKALTELGLSETEANNILLNFFKELNKSNKLKKLNQQRDKELKGFVINDIFINEDIIKTMAVAYNIAADNETIEWIDINNKVVKFTKADFGALIKQGSDRVKEIYFKYRKLKDKLLSEE